MAKYHIITFGCQMNERDSEYIAGTLEAMGYENTESLEDADLIFLNTCTIREKAENKAMSLLGKLRKNKEENPDLIIAVSGCLSQEEGKAKRIASRLSHVDLIVGTHNLHEISAMLKKVLNKEGQQISIWSEEGDIYEGLPDKQALPFRSLINIVYGCNNFCTYCIVPFVRGRERSRLPLDIINEVKNKASQGVKEIMLLGQNVNSYGKDFTDKNYNFAHLIKDLNQVEGLEWIRYMTSHPRDFSDQLIEAIAQSPKVTDHFHLPVQSGSSDILKRMNRGYSREYYLDLVEKIREIRPQAAITTDLIVGFPGESEKDFLDTMDLVREVNFASAYSFIYSPRLGTPASKFKEQVPLKEKKARIHALNKLISQQEIDYNKKLENTIQRALVEDSYKEEGKLLGRTSAFRSVVFEGGQDLIGQFVNLKIINAGKQLKGNISD